MLVILGIVVVLAIVIGGSIYLGKDISKPVNPLWSV